MASPVVSCHNTSMTIRPGRLLSLLQAFREHRAPVTAATLAERFEVSERTIHRDLTTLREIGAPIDGEAGVGFVLGPGFFLPPLALDEVEADAVLLGLRFVRRRGDDALADAARSALAKIAAGMDDDAERNMREGGLTVGPSVSEASGTLGAVRAAMREGRKLRIAYRDRRERGSERTVWPVAIGFFDDAEMLAAWCESREAFRHFRLDRIASLAVLDERPPVLRRTLLAEYRLTEPDADL